MDNAAQARFATAFFLKLTDTKHARLRNGLTLRRQLGLALERGEDPQHYRIEWLKKTTMRLVEELGRAARDFDEEHADDMISVSDMVDAVASTLTTLQKAAAVKRSR